MVDLLPVYSGRAEFRKVVVATEHLASSCVEEGEAHGEDVECHQSWPANGFAHRTAGEHTDVGFVIHQCIDV